MSPFNISLLILMVLIFKPLSANDSCQQLHQHQQMLIKYQHLIEKIMSNKMISSLDLNPIETYYRDQQKNQDTVTIIENLDSEALSRGQVTFTNRESSAWWLMREEFEQSKATNQQKKLKAFIANQSWWKGNLKQTMISLKDQLEQCSSSCVKNLDHDSPFLKLHTQLSSVNEALLSKELKRYQNHLEFKNLGQEKVHPLTLYVLIVVASGDYTRFKEMIDGISERRQRKHYEATL